MAIWVSEQGGCSPSAWHTTLYRYTAVRMGHDVGYPLWLGGYHLLRTVVPAGLGVTEEHLENKAQDRWPTPAPPHTPGLTGPRR